MMIPTTNLVTSGSVNYLTQPIMSKIVAVINEYDLMPLLKGTWGVQSNSPDFRKPNQAKSSKYENVSTVQQDKPYSPALSSYQQKFIKIISGKVKNLLKDVRLKPLSTDESDQSHLGTYSKNNMKDDSSRPSEANSENKQVNHQIDRLFNSFTNAVFRTL